MIFLRKKGFYSVRPKLYWFHYIYLILLASPKKPKKKENVIKRKKGGRQGRRNSWGQLQRARFCNFQYDANNDHFGRTLSVGRALFWAPHHNVKAWVKLYSYPLLPPPLTCLPSAPRQAANGRTSIIFASIDISCILQGCISFQIAFVKRD